MKPKFTFTRGIAALALSASLLMGCQDFLSEDKPVQSAQTRSEEVQVAAQEASVHAGSPQAGASSEPAKNSAVVAAEPPKPLTAETAPIASVPDNAADCKEIHAQMMTAMQAGQDLLYLELKNKFGSLGCDITQFSVPTVPPVPPDQATVCKNLQASLAQMDPGSAKYAVYQQDFATNCTDVKTPASPVATPSTPVPPATLDNAGECQDIFNQMQTAKDPLYGELKNKFGSLNCDHSKIVHPVVPVVPPDSATICNNLKSTLATIEPGTPKYISYQEEIARNCAAHP